MRLPILLALFLVLPALHSEELSEKVDTLAMELHGAMIAEARSDGDKVKDNRFVQETPKLAIASRLKSLVENSKQQGTAEILSQTTTYFESDAVLQKAAELAKKIEEERAAADKASIQMINETLDRAGKTARSAKVPADLDELISELSGLRQRPDGQRSAAVREAFQKISPTLDAVIHWQNYLSAKQTGNQQGEQEALRSLSSPNSPNLIPRSKLLELLAQVSPESLTREKPSVIPEVDKIMAEVKSLADLGEALRQLQKIQKGRNSFSQMETLTGLTSTLQTLDTAYNDFLAGLPVDFEISRPQRFGNDQLWNTKISPLRSELLMLLIPRYTGAPEGTRPQPGETAEDFLLRLAEEAENRGDVKNTLRCREALQMMGKPNTFPSTDRAATSFLAAAKNQEKAGQIVLALTSYQAALRTGSDLIPADWIGQRLDVIKTKHPAEYAAVVERVLSPPAPPHLDGGAPRIPQPVPQPPGPTFPNSTISVPPKPPTPPLPVAR